MKHLESAIESAKMWSLNSSAVYCVRLKCFIYTDYDATSSNFCRLVELRSSLREHGEEYLVPSKIK